MKPAVRQTRSHLMELFARHGFHPRTDFGQNFLIDLNLVDVLAREARLGLDDVVLEVGTGTGSSPGRPKATPNDQENHWQHKFPRNLEKPLPQKYQT